MKQFLRRWGVWLAVIILILIFVLVTFLNSGIADYDSGLGGGNQLYGYAAANFGEDRFVFETARNSLNGVTASSKTTKNNLPMESPQGEVDVSSYGEFRIEVRLYDTRMTPELAAKFPKDQILTEPVKAMKYISAMWVSQASPEDPLVLTFFSDEQLETQPAHGGREMVMVFNVKK